MTIITQTISNVYDNLIAVIFYTNSDITGNDIIINCFSTDPTLSHQVFMEQEINLAWT